MRGNPAVHSRPSFKVTSSTAWGARASAPGSGPRVNTRTSPATTARLKAVAVSVSRRRDGGSNRSVGLQNVGALLEPERQILNPRSHGRCSPARYDGDMAGWRLEHTYAELPQLFHSPAAPTAVREPRLVAFNRPLAAMLGLDPEALEGPGRRRDFRGQCPARRRRGRSRRRTPATSSATSPPSAMAARSCSASRSRRPAIAWTFN